jgi:superfamily II DNA or RNA helicase
LVNNIHVSLLSKGNFLKMLSSKKKLQKEMMRSKFKLDEWQEKVIDIITPEDDVGKSVLISVPTSGGKTFISFSILRNLLDNEDTKDTKDNEDTKGVIAYVAPTFHLAFQTYCNLTKTFPRVKISLLTGIINDIVDNTIIWIGTPREMLSYFTSKNIRFSRGIFDEIHTISPNYNSTLNNLHEDNSLSLLLSRCNSQVIALSATIKQEDIKTLVNYISTTTGIKDIEVVSHDKRSIPLYSHVWDGNSISTINKNQQSTISPEDTWKLIKQMDSKKYLPSLIFESTENFCYTSYVDLVNWLKENNKRVYSNWHHLNNVYLNRINEVNENLGELHNLDSNGKHHVVISGLLSSRKELLNEIINDLKSAILDSNDIELSSLKEELDLFNKLPKNDLRLVPMLCNGIGPYFKLGNTPLNLFKKILEPQTHEDHKKHKFFISLCNKEFIKDNEIKRLVKILDLGLSFGVAMILPTLPFSIIYELLKLVHNRQLPVIFTSSSMSMGINYPIKSVVVRSKDLINENVAKAMQMAGRCGRRRLDTEGHVIYYNIENADKISNEFLPSLTLPEVNTKQMYDIKLFVELKKYRYLLPTIKEILPLNKVKDFVTYIVDDDKESIVNDEDQNLKPQDNTRLNIKYLIVDILKIFYLNFIDELSDKIFNAFIYEKSNKVTYYDIEIICKIKNKILNAHTYMTSSVMSDPWLEVLESSFYIFQRVHVLFLSKSMM